MKPLYLLLAVASLSFASCRFGMGRKIRGNGNVTTSTRNPGDFHRVEQKGSFDLVLKTGEVASVQIEAEENIAAHIETTVSGGTLEIRTEEGFRLSPSHDIRIVVTAPAFDGVASFGSGNTTSEGMISDSTGIKVSTSGSGDITLQVQAPEVHAESYGSGNIQLSGQTRDFSLETAGSGDLAADGLQAENVTIEINGSGSAKVNASKSLDVSVRGSGDVSYKGNPSLKTDIKGSGSLHKMD